MKRITIILFLCIATAIQAQSNFIISAHRGNSSAAPENTMSAFRSAINAEADFFECDVRRTRDGQLVLMHDSSLNRTTNSNGSLRNYNLNQLLNVDAGYPSRFGSQFAGERIPTLQQALQLAKGTISVEIEIKESGLADDVVALVNQLEMQNQVLIISFNFNEIRRVKQISTIPVKYLVGPFWGSRQLRQLQGIGGEYFGPRGVVSSSRVVEANRMGIKIISYTINSERQIRRAIRNGQYGIATDYPARAIAIRDGIGKSTMITPSAFEHTKTIITPNPIQSKFSIQPQNNQKANVRLLDYLGKEIFNFGTVITESVAIPWFIKNGNYLIEVQTNDQIEHIKVILK